MTHTSEKHFTDEELELVTRGKADGMYMKAPNGSPTSLDERQWVQVRTRAFKNWFGDWENAPEAASRIVDENGEPLVVHHGTPLRRDQITPERGWQRDGITYIPQKAPFHTFKGGEYSGLIFTSVDAEKARGIAETRAMSIPDDKYGNEQWTEEGYVYDLYVNSRNPFDPKDGQAVKKILQSLGSEIPVLSFYGGKGDTVSPEKALELASSERNCWMLTETPEFLSKVREAGYDGLVIFSEADLKITAHERFRFIGEKGASRLDRSEGASLRLENLAVAREMEKSGKDAGTIKTATGWERGADSKWRYETADFEYHPAGDLGYSRLLERQSWHGEFENLLDRQIEGETLSEAEWKRFEELTELAAGLKEQDALRERIYLDDYVKDDELFQAYPEMKRTRLEFVDLPSADYCGAYLHPDNRIVINISRADDVRPVLAHEIQHAIQAMEGFARGSNPGEFKNTAENVILDIVRATDGRILEGGGFDNTPDGIFAALNRETAYGGTILRDNSSSLDAVAGKYGYETIFDLVNDIGSFRSSIQEYLSTAGEVEARNVESRLDFTSAQRRNTLAVSTEDIARDGQIFLSRDAQMDEFARHVSFLAGKLHVPVEVIRRADEIGSPDIRGLLSCGKDIRGWYDIPSQRVCLYLPHARGKADVERTLLHEGVAHYGLRKLAGHKHMDAFLDDIFNGCGEKVRDEILRMAAADRTDIRVATEEYLARMAEDGTDRSLWDRIVTAFRNLLRKLGFCLEIGTRELRGILAASQKNLTGIAEPAVIQTARGDLELSCGYGRAVLRRQGVETDATSLLERMRKAGISPASLGQEDWKAVFNGGIILPGGRKLMAVREPAGYGMRISGVSPGSARESGMEM